jgi:microcin C transport system ATP-binding protein
VIADEPTTALDVTVEAQASAPVIFDAEQLAVTFKIRRGWLGREAEPLRAVDGVSLQIREGQTVGVVGESGSGKSTLGRALLRLLPAEGRLVYLGRDLMGLDQEAMRPLRRELQVVFQDPFGSLSPRLTVGEIVGEGLRVHAPELDARERGRRVAEALEQVQLDARYLRRFPHEFSGGQRQRIAIARALVLRPRFVLLDEPTSALDRTIQKQIVELLRDLQARHGLTYLFISHDLAVVRAMADTVLVMQHGRIVEAGPAERIFQSPREPYTQALLAAAFDLEVKDAAAS